MRKQLLLSLFCGVLMFSVTQLTVRAEDSVLLEGVRQIADRHKVETSEEARERIEQQEDPLFSFVQVADAHHHVGGQKKNKWLYRGLAYVSREIQPAFVVFTGDNITADSVEHQKQFRSLIQSKLDVPVHLIRGDNDEEHFHDVFGSSKWSFDYGGVHFMGTSIDVDQAPGKGTGYFSTDTIDWMKRDLERNDRPTVVFFHETVWPATFTDAPRLAHLLRSDSNVLFLSTGHLHRDLEVDVNGLKQFVAPSVRRSKHHGIKEYRVYRNKLVLVTHDTRGGAYAPAPKYQEVKLDASLPEMDEELNESTVNELPPQEMTYAEELGWYRRKVRSMMMNQLIQRFWGGDDQNR